MSQSLKQFAIYLGILALGGTTGFYVSESFREKPSKQVTPPQVEPIQLPQSSPPTPAPSLEKSSFIAKAAETVGPAVVRLDAAQIVSQQEQQRFYRRFFKGESPDPGQREIPQGTGSGFIFSSDGLVLTNAHVVEDADAVEVTLKDGRSFQGKVVGSDPITDVAVIKIPAKDLPTVSLGTSEDVIPGDWAIAIGNPLGLDNTVTVGIISATGRSSSQVGIPDKRVSFIQTDAAINPGNSGGPLLNAQGEVIGVNTAIRANAQGLGFAIPIEIAARIANELITQGEAKHPYLGIRMVTLSPSVRKELQANNEFKVPVKADQGVLVVEVINNSPADRAGFRKGDIILEVGGNAIETANDVQQAVEKSQIGNQLTVSVNRNGNQETLMVRPGQFPRDQLD